VVVAGGSGRRFGGLKQFLSLAGEPVVGRALSAARSVADGIVLVVPGGPASEAPGTPAPVGAGDLDARDLDADVTVPGGATRADSVRAGLAAVDPDAEVVVVHDAARPLASPALFAAVVAAVRAGADGAVPALPVADTLKRVDGDRIVATVDRTGLVAVQTPQAFAAASLRAAHRGGGEATDDAGLVEAWGGTVVTVPGEPGNLKITGPGDVVVAEALLSVVAG
jgi:2-C-methyl-D-erythritol 4-phosphate cytidylyltransferase